jgi:hypothetical protein
MSEIGLSATEEAHVQQAADEAFRVLTGEEDEFPPPRDRFLQMLRQATLQAPLHSLAVAFLLGALLMRRR